MAAVRTNDDGEALDVSRGSRSDFGALLVGHYVGNDLAYAGKVGTGFNHQTLRQLGARLRHLEQPSSPFAPFRPVPRRTHWVSPDVVAEVAFAEWTGDGRLRHPRYRGLRMDKDPRSWSESDRQADRSGRSPHRPRSGPGDCRATCHDVPGPSRRPDRSSLPGSLPAAGCHRPLRPDHRRVREQGGHGLVETWPTPWHLAAADQDALEELVRPCGFFRTKAIRLRALSQVLVDSFAGEVPTTIEELTTLPGVGRKTANVVLSVGLGLPGLAVDTHVRRVSRRLGLTTNSDPDKIEQDLCRLLPPGSGGPSACG